MESTQKLKEDSWELIHELLSRGFSASEISASLRVKIGRGLSESEHQQVLQRIKLRGAQHGRALPHDAETQEQERDLDTADKMTAAPRRQLSSGNTDGLVEYTTPPEMEDLSRDTCSQPPGDVFAVATGHAVDVDVAVPATVTVRLAPTNPTIPAPSPLNLGRPSGFRPPFYTPTPALSDGNIGDAQGTHYAQFAASDGLEAGGSSSEGDGGSSDGGTQGWRSSPNSSFDGLGTGHRGSGKDGKSSGGGQGGGLSCHE